jgi:dihydrofolate reductase
MGRVIVIAFITLDGFASDPDGSDGTPTGGWAFRHEPGLLKGDRFQLGAALDTGVMVFGRRTWEAFAGRWPHRTGEFAERMNAAAKLVVTRSGVDVGAWANSVAADGDLTELVTAESSRRDVIVTGSLSVVHALLEHDLVDEYRLVVCPSVIGAGTELFPAGTRPADFTEFSAQQSGAAVLLTAQRGAAPARTASTSASANPSSGT